VELSETLAPDYDAILLAVAHEPFKTIDFAAYQANGAIIYDAKGVIDPELVDGRL
jgi:UDP-N-acetyl-D-galactosamine dehydrogenase